MRTFLFLLMFGISSASFSQGVAVNSSGLPADTSPLPLISAAQREAYLFRA